MLFTALCVSLPREAQEVLPAFLWLLPFLFFFFFEGPKLTTAVAQRTLKPLFLKAVAEVTGSQAKLAQWKANTYISKLLDTCVRLTLTYVAGKNVAKFLAGASPSSSKGRRAPADDLASLDDTALCERVLSVAGQSLPARSPASLRSFSNPSDARVCATLFATTTPVALTSYLRHVLACAGHGLVTIYVPGLLAAPWTSHLLPLLRRVQRQHGAHVVGYDLYIDAHHYEVDVRHLQQLAQQQQCSDLSGSSRTRLSAGSSKAASTAVPPAPTPALDSTVLILASLRGRSVHNRDAAVEYAKSRGWQVMELCLPTLPPQAITMTTTADSNSAVTAAAANLALHIAPDIHITAYDDAGMYGGAVVHLCVNDRRLLARMFDECQVGLAEVASRAASGTPKRRAARSCSKSSTRDKSSVLPMLHSTALVTTVTDLGARSSEFLINVWLPWSSRLYYALQAEAEASALRRVRATAQQSWILMTRFLTETLPMVPFTAQQRIMSLLPGRALQDRLHALAGKSAEDSVNSCAATAAAAAAAAAEAVGSQNDASRSVADATVEQRTTMITQPLPPLDLLPPTPPARQSSQQQQEAASPASTQRAEASKEKEEQKVPLLPSADAEGAESTIDGRGGGNSALMSWMPQLPKPGAATAAGPKEAKVVNTPAEWHIRLRWTALLLATYGDGITGAGVAAPSLPPSSPAANDVCAAAYVSLWSFIAQLPPWVAAVSAEGEESPANGWNCVEVAATALLVRVAYPASSRAVAQLLRDEADVDARAVSTYAWQADSARQIKSNAATTTNTTSHQCVFHFEDAAVMPGCPHAAALAEELVYLPLAPNMATAVRGAVLRVLWEKVPHAYDSVKAHRRADGAPPHVLKTLRVLNRAYMTDTPDLVRSDGERPQGTRKSKYHPLRLDTDNLGFSAQDVEQAQQLLFRSAQSAAAAAVMPPSFVTEAATSLVTPLQNSVVQRLLSKL